MVMTLTNEPIKTPATGFRWSYIALPAAILTASLILTAFFYARLPAELAYHFKNDGTPDRTLGRVPMLFVLLFPQVLLTLVAAGTAWAMAKISSRLQPVQIAIKPDNIIRLMGNILALPEMVLAFFMLDVFLYNAFQIHFLPVWLTGAAVMVIGGIVIAVFFSRAFREARRTTH
jgi:uncharacterized membrane protein